MFIVVYLMQVKHLTLGKTIQDFNREEIYIYIYLYVYYCIAILDNFLVLHGDF